jgi:hypothetical protein
MKSFQLVHNGKRIARLFVNCQASSNDISQGLIIAALAFKIAAEEDENEDCGLEYYSSSLLNGASVEIYHVEEGGVDG